MGDPVWADTIIRPGPGFLMCASPGRRTARKYSALLHLSQGQEAYQGAILGGVGYVLGTGAKYRGRPRNVLAQEALQDRWPGDQV